MNSVIKNGDNVDFKVDAGSTWPINIAWSNNDGTPIDLSGYTARMYLKRTYSSVAAFMLTTANGRLTVGNGFINWLVTDEETSALSGNYIYDIEVESYTGAVTRLFQGNIVINPEVTK